MITKKIPQILAIFFSTFLFLAITTTNNANANMFNKFKKGFYFEKYKTAEEAKAALLELHPIGSDVGELVKRLEGAGVKKCAVTDGKVNTKSLGNGSFMDSLNIKKQISAPGDYYDCSYRERQFLIFSNGWSIFIGVNPNDFTKISNISIRAAVDAL